MSTTGDVLRRRLIAIATGTFAADATFAALDVQAELSAVTRWLSDRDLQERGFSDKGYEKLARSPTYDEIRKALTKGEELNAGDAIAVYVTGHGCSDQGVHWVVLRESDPTRLSHDSLSTAELIRWLAAYRSLTHALVIIDLCQAGDALDELPATLQRDLPEGWLALFTVPAGTDAGLGAFAAALESVLDDYRVGSAPGSNTVDPYLTPSEFVPVLQRRLYEQTGQALQSLRLPPYEQSVCLPNPRYDATAAAAVATSASLRELAVPQSALDSHWLQRAPVTSELGSVFTGRRTLMARLIDFVAGDPVTLLVTGRAGCGKSSALARLVTCSDAAFREEYAEILAVAEPVPPVDSIDVAVLATGKTPDQIARQLAEALGVEAPTADASLQEWIEAIRMALERRDSPVTVIIDALDEASDPAGVAFTLLERLNPEDRRVMRLLIGVRSSGAEPGAAQRGRELADTVARALNAPRLQVDADEFWEPEDLADYASQLLARGKPPTPNQRDLADRIATRSGRSYLVAGLVARHLARSSDGEVGDDAVLAALNSGVLELVLADLQSSITDPGGRERVWQMLRATALAFGRGIPWRDVWASAATALDSTRPVVDDDVQWLLDHRSSGYLIRDLEDGSVVYRPFHDELKTALAKGRAADADQRSAHHAISDALLDLAGWRRDETMTRLPPAYVRRHLASHAAEAGILEEILEADRLPYLDPVRLSELLRLTEAPPHSGQWLLLGAWRSVRHRLSFEDPTASVAAYDHALLANGMTPPSRETEGFHWSPRWTQWMTGGTVVGALEGTPFSTFGHVEGRGVLGVGGHGEVLVWDAATGSQVGEHLRAGDAVAAVAMGGDRGDLVAAISRAGELRVWDAARRELLHHLRVPDSLFRTLATARLAGRWVVVTGGGDGEIHVYWMDSGLQAMPPFGRIKAVRSIAVASTRNGARAVVGDQDGVVAQYDLDRAGAAVEPPIEMGEEVNAVDLFDAGPSGLIVAVGTTRGRAVAFDAETRQVLGPFWQHTAEVRAVALGVVGGQPMLAAGAMDGAVQVGPAVQPSVGLRLPHSSAVTSVEFGVVDGRSMLATSCQDGGTRLWDPVQPSAPRTTVDAHIDSVSFLRGPEGVLDVVTTDERSRLQVWSGADGGLRAQVDVATDPLPPARGKGVTSMPVAAGDVDGRRLVVASYEGAVQVWELVGRQDAELALVREFPAPHGRWRPVIPYVGGGRALFATQEEWERPTKIYDAFSGRSLGLEVDRGGDFPNLLGFHEARGRTWFAVSREHRLALFDVENGEQLGPSVEVSSDYGHIALGVLEGHEVLAIRASAELRLVEVTSGRDRIEPIQKTAGGWVSFATVGNRDVLLTQHPSTIRAWNPYTGRQLAKLPFGTNIGPLAVQSTDGGGAHLAVGGPGLLLTTLTEHAAAPWAPPGD